MATHSGHYFAVDVPHDGVPRFWLDRRLFRQQGPQVAGIDAGRHPLTLQRAYVLADVLDHFLTAHAELIDVHDVGVCPSDWNAAIFVRKGASGCTLD